MEAQGEGFYGVRDPEWLWHDGIHGWYLGHQ